MCVSVVLEFSSFSGGGGGAASVLLFSCAFIPLGLLALRPFVFVCVLNCYCHRISS